MNIAKHCIACTLNGLSDDGTCFPTAEMIPYRRLYKIILPKAPLMTAEVTMVKRVHVIRNSQQISTLIFLFTEADVKVTKG